MYIYIHENQLKFQFHNGYIIYNLKYTYKKNIYIGFYHKLYVGKGYQQLIYFSLTELGVKYVATVPDNLAKSLLFHVIHDQWNLVVICNKSTVHCNACF